MWSAAVVPPANPVAVGDGLEIAAIGLVGVLVGALISGGFNLWVARRKERSDAAAESKRHDVEVRRAARLVDDDLHSAADAVSWSVEHKEWWTSAQRLTSDGWGHYRDVLAGGSESSAFDWEAVNLAVMLIDRLQWTRDESAKAHRAKLATDPDTAGMVAAGDRFDLNVVDPVPMTDALATQIQGLLRGLEMGRAALAPLMRDKPAKR